MLETELVGIRSGSKEEYLLEMARCLNNKI